VAIASKTTNNNGVMIHYMDSKQDSDRSLIPLLICPGLSETAEEYVDFLEYIFPRRGIVLSFRGRGQSETPPKGYNLEHHVSDIESVVRQSGVKYFHLFGYSRGVSYALGYAKRNQDQIASIIVQDYPCEHKAMPPTWPEDYIENYLIPHHRTLSMRPEAVRGIQIESTQEIIKFKFERSMLVIRGLLEGSLLSGEDIKRYRNQFLDLQICEFKKSGHDIRHTEKARLYETITEFLA